MDGKESVCKILRSFVELNETMNRDLLMDYIMGRPTQQMSQRGLDNTENYGCGDDKEEDHWTMVIDQAIEEGLLKSSSVGISIAAKGKKFLKKPTEFMLKDEDEEVIDENIGDIDDNDLLDDSIPTTPKTQSSKSSTSQRKLALIQAVDRHVAIDDFASNHGYDFDEVLNDMEAIISSGTKLDLTYFGIEVLGEEAMEELFDYYEDASDDNLDKAIDEYGDVYSKEELHLGRILWRVSKM